MAAGVAGCVGGIAVGDDHGDVDADRLRDLRNECNHDSNN